MTDCHSNTELAPTQQGFTESHFSIGHWAQLWGFSVKTVREWFRDEYGPGILRQANVRRRSKRDYTTIMISPSAAARVYARHSGGSGPLNRMQEVM